ncbi:hypothetical protein AVEN_177471-1 [Araneus ventricosus]|uniref:Uncharacterized protein n=1 Tax=Araneus ventricosus TaxID=182803 RepID=A0A4Y2LTE9_ARAVE|nr:hypothetical protein AVEN_177471-1 [Araneus ventricosus]
MSHDCLLKGAKSTYAIGLPAQIISEKQRLGNSQQESTNVKEAIVVNLLRLTNTLVVTDVSSYDVSGCIGNNGAATFTTILSLPDLLKPVADEHMEEGRAVSENDSSATTSLIEDFPNFCISRNFIGDIANS